MLDQICRKRLERLSSHVPESTSVIMCFRTELPLPKLIDHLKLHWLGALSSRIVDALSKFRIKT